MPTSLQEAAILRSQALLPDGQLPDLGKEALPSLPNSGVPLCRERGQVGRPRGLTLTSRHLCCCCRVCTDNRLRSQASLATREAFSCIWPWSSAAACAKLRTSRVAARFWEEREGLLSPGSSLPREVAPKHGGPWGLVMHSLTPGTENVPIWPLINERMTLLMMG